MNPELEKKLAEQFGNKLQPITTAAEGREKKRQSASCVRDFSQVRIGGKR